MDNCWQAVVAIYAVMKAGAAVSPVNPSTKADKLAYILNNCSAAAIFTLERLTKTADRAIEQAPSIHLKIATGEGAKEAGYACFEDILSKPDGGNCRLPGSSSIWRC